MKNITFSANDSLIRKARLKAAKENTTLNQRFREWLERYASQTDIESEYENIREKMKYARSGGKFKRDELNER